MYRQLQEKVKRHVIERLCKISDKWEFDIDTTNIEEPIIVGNGPDEMTIRTPIEEIHCSATKELINDITIFCNSHSESMGRWGGCTLLKMLMSDVFSIYGVDIIHKNQWRPHFKIVSKNKEKSIKGEIWCILEEGEMFGRVILPFWPPDLEKYIMTERYVSPLLLLLDPIIYFRQYSAIINKWPELNVKHTIGIYELLLEYFPEMNDELVGKYLFLWYIFQDVCRDIVFLIGMVQVDLYAL